jgi:hypothetical protein
MTTTDHPRIMHQFLGDDYDTDDLFLSDELCSLVSAGDHTGAAEFIRQHSDLDDQRIRSLIIEIVNRQAEHGEDGRDHVAFPNMHRTRDEVDDAYQQINQRRWYGRLPREARLRLAKTPESLTSTAASLDEIEATYGDVDDSKYYTDFNWGYLAGVQSALSWVLGNAWGDMDT